MGGLAGSALLGTFQIAREKYHSHELVQSIVMTDPLVAARMRASAGVLAPTQGDAAYRAAAGGAILAQQVSREANILAFNDVFLLVGVLALITEAWGIAIRLSIWRRREPSPVVQLQQRMAQAAAAAADPGS